MYEAHIEHWYGVAKIGPTDSRDEASRLARAWLELATGGQRQWGIANIRIVRVDDDSEERDAE